MKKTLIICCICFYAFSSMAPEKNIIETDDKKFPSLIPAISDESPAVIRWIDSAYTAMDLETIGLKKNVFFYACKGYEYLLKKNKCDNSNLLTICDYSQSSKYKRLYVLDLIQEKVLYNTYVSHGKNSGMEYANTFSNSEESHKSSLGFMVTGETYTGKNGYSMHLDGMEKGINDHVRERDIVMHGSNYVNAERTDENIGMGRSYGCPAVSYAEHKKIIDKIKGGSCFFVYADNSLYATSSKILNAHVDWSLPGTTPLNFNFPAVESTAVIRP